VHSTQSVTNGHVVAYPFAMLCQILQRKTASGTRLLPLRQCLCTPDQHYSLQPDELLKLINRFWGAAWG
jgi:hypothetical protein